MTPIAGVVADRVDQRKLLFTTQALALVAAALLGLLVLNGRVELWHVYLQVAFQAGVSGSTAPSGRRCSRGWSPRSHLTEAVTLSSTAGGRRS